MTTRKKIGTALGFVSAAIALATVYLWFRQVNVVSIPTDRTLFVASFITAAAMGLSSFIVGTRWFGAIPAILALIIGSFLPFTVAISEQIVADNPIAVGDTIPRFIAIDDTGNRFASGSLSGHITLIKFFRAHW